MEKNIKEIYKEHIEKISDEYLEDNCIKVLDGTNGENTYSSFSYSSFSINESYDYAKEILTEDNNPYFEEFLDDINEQAYPEKEYTSEEVLKIVGNINK